MGEEEFRPDMDTYKRLNLNLFPIPDGKYYVHSTINDRYVWDMNPNDCNLHLWEKHGGANQQFIFKSDNVARYTIYCAQNGKAIDCAGGDQSSGANVWLYSPNKTPAQQWYLRGREAGYFSAYSGINPSKNKRCIDLTHSNAQNGTNICCFQDNGTNAQIWYVEPC